MNNPTILVVDGDPKNLQILQESLEKANFDVITTNNGNDAWTAIQSEKIDIILSEVDIPVIDGFQLLKKLQSDPAATAIPLVFLTNRRNLEDRIKSLRSGVKDYMIKPLHVKEVIARLQMILRRLERVKTEDVEFSRKVTGRLDEQTVEELVENYGTERKTGVLTIYDQDNHSGEIYFRDGAVINARLGNFRAEKAVYQMLPWRRGHFIMMFQDVSVNEEITVSNLGLLLQGFKRLQDREKLFKLLPSPDTVFVKTPIFDKVLSAKKISSDALKFITLFDGKRKITDIISESTYDDLKTLERINKLYQQHFIRPAEATPAAPVERPIDRLTEPASAPPVQKPRPPVEVEPKIALPKQIEPEPPRKEDISTIEVSSKIQIVEDIDPPEDMTIPEIPKAPEERPEMPEIYELPVEAKNEPAGETDYEISEAELENQEQPSEKTPALPEEISLPEPFTLEPEDRNNGFEKIPPEKTYTEKVSVYTPPPPETSNEHSHTGNGTPVLPEESTNNEQQEFSENEFSDIGMELLKLRRQTNGHLVIIGSNNRHRRELISTLTNGNFSSKTLSSQDDASIDYGKLAVSNQNTIEIIGVPTERKFLEMLDRVSPTLIGYVVLVVSDASSNLGYLGYLINSLKDKFSAPHVVAVTHPTQSNPMPLDFVRYSLNLQEDEQIVDLKGMEIASLQYLLRQLKPPVDTQTIDKNVTA